MRLFTGVALDPDLRRDVDQLARSWRPLAPQLKWVEPELYHLTLRFLGETASLLLPALTEALSTLGERRPFDLELGGPIAIPSGRRARVLALDLVDRDRQLAKLAQALSRAIRPLGFPKEQRAFRAHLTLARARRGETLPSALDPRQLAGLAAEAPTISSPGLPTGGGGTEWAMSGRRVLAVRACHLYESHLRPGGPVYRMLATIALNG